MNSPVDVNESNQSEINISLHSMSPLRSSQDIVAKFIQLLATIEEKAGASRFATSEEDLDSDYPNDRKADEEQLTSLLEVAQQKLCQKEQATCLMNTLYNYVQIVSAGLTHWIHRKRIYQNILEAAAPFLKTLIQECVKVMDGCRAYFELNWTAETSQFTCPSKLIEETVKLFILSTENGSVIPCVAKFFMFLIKHFKSKMTRANEFCSMLLRHLDSLVANIVSNSKTHENGNRASDIKKTNYFGTIVERYCSICTPYQDKTSCLLDSIQVARIVEINELDSDVSSFYPKLVLNFCTLDVPFSSLEYHLQSWPVKYRIKFKFKLMVHSLRFRDLHLELTLTSALNDVVQCSDEIEEEKGVISFQQFIDEELLPQIFQLVCSLNSTQFDAFQESLLTFVLEGETTHSSFTVWYLLADIFGFIVRLAPDELIEEYLELFSSNNAPCSVKYFLLPQVVKYSRNQTIKQEPGSDLLSMKLIELLKIKEQTEAEGAVPSPDLKFIKLFWSRHNHRWKNNLPYQMLPICVHSVGLIPDLDSEIISLILACLEEQIGSKPLHPCSLLATSIFLHGFQHRSFKSDSKEWKSLSAVCTKILDKCFLRTNCESLPKPVRRFVVKSFSAFLGRVEIDSDEVLQSLCPSIWNNIESKTERESGWSNCLEQLENCVTRMEEKNLKIPDGHRHRLRALSSRLDRLVHANSNGNGTHPDIQDVDC